MFAYSINEDEQAVFDEVRSVSESVNDMIQKLENELIAIYMGLDTGPDLDAEGMRVLSRVDDVLALLKVLEGLWHEAYVAGLEA